MSNATLFANAGWFRKIKCKPGNAMCKWQRKLVPGNFVAGARLGPTGLVPKAPFKGMDSVIICGW
jgi:hypothetical protein